MKTEYLIIGNSVSGVNCIEGIRCIDRKGKIIVVSDESVYNYSRPLISYYLGGRIGEKELAFKSRDFYTRNGVELLLNTRVEKIDVMKKMAYCEGRVIEFKKLLISTGGKPIIPDIKGYDSDKKGLFTFTRLDDAKKLIEYIRENNVEEALVLGGGLIGLKCVEGLVDLGIRVVIVELADRFLANTLDTTGSSIIENILREKKGCRVFKEDTVVEIEFRNKKVSAVILKLGRKIEINLVVIAVGVRPDIEIVKDTGIKCGRGIVVNSRMQTSCRDIYAAGDVAEGMNCLLGENSVIAIWPVAARQGKVAGINMAGGDAVYEGMFPMNAVDIAGIPVISFGITNPSSADECEVLQKRGDDFYKKIILKNNVIIGCIFAGKVERSGIFSKLISDRVNVSRFKNELLSDNFGLLLLPEEYRKHLVSGEGIEV